MNDTRAVSAYPSPLGLTVVGLTVVLESPGAPLSRRTASVAARAVPFDVSAEMRQV